MTFLILNSDHSAIVMDQLIHALFITNESIVYSLQLYHLRPDKIKLNRSIKMLSLTIKLNLIRIIDLPILNSRSSVHNKAQ